MILWHLLQTILVGCRVLIHGSNQFRGCRQPLPWRTGSTLQVLRLLPEPQGIKPIVTRQPTTTNTKQPISLTSKHRHLQRTPSEITKSNRRAPSSLTDFTPKHAQIKPPRSNLQTRSPISPEPRTNRTPVRPPISPMDFTRATHGSNPRQRRVRARNCSEIGVGGGSGKSKQQARGDHGRRRRAETTTGRILTCSGGGCGRAGGGRRRDDGGVRRAGRPRERRSGGRRGGTGRGRRGRGRRATGAPCGRGRRRRGSGSEVNFF